MLRVVYSRWLHVGLLWWLWVAPAGGVIGKFIGFMLLQNFFIDITGLAMPGLGMAYQVFSDIKLYK